MQFKSLFVTGTDTGVGKTTVSCGIAAALRRRGLTVGAFKPAETGCPRQSNSELQPDDARRLRFFAECAMDLQAICPYALRDPLAPLLAARNEGLQIDVMHLIEGHRAMAAAHHVTLIEGAGGLLVPLTAELTFADLVPRLNAALVVIVGSRLGAINHALLTVRYARSVGLHVLGYVVNFLNETADLAARTNVPLLDELLGPALGVVPYLGEIGETDATRARLGELFEEVLRVDALLLPA